ncbi:MAG: polysaccharide pyruvyl transferase family protein [Candidatus Omnitrophota bacterium]
MKKIRILVTGLCLSRNRGGAAMALSFMRLMDEYAGAPFEYVFAVDPVHLELEKEWGKKYGVRAVPRDTVTLALSTLPVFSFIRAAKAAIKGKKSAGNAARLRKTAHDEYMRSFREADCVINLNGIAFVGDGTRRWKASLNELTDGIYARAAKKPFFRFIQSYGPFNDRRVRFMASREFRRLKCVMARGKRASGFCREAAGKTPVYCFPDVAVILPRAGKEWLEPYLSKLGAARGEYMIFSPSAVITALKGGGGTSTGEGHIDMFCLAAKHYLGRGKTLIFLPHMTSPVPSECDREVCRIIIRKLAESGADISRCVLIEDELDCRELKALISAARLAVVSRYHALVAALSSGVPAVPVGWNDKYMDLLDFYGAAQFAVDARSGEPPVTAARIIENAGKWTPEKIEKMRSLQKGLEAEVRDAGRICGEWIQDVTGQK